MRGCSTPGAGLEAGGCMMDGSGRAGEGHNLNPLCCPAGAKRSAPSGPSASNARSAVTATTGASVRPPLAPVSVNLATKAHAARSGCAPRVCTAQAVPCPALVMPTTPSGTSCRRVGWAQVKRGLLRAQSATSSLVIQVGQCKSRDLSNHLC